VKSRAGNVERAVRELRELSELFDLAAIPQAETLVERARLFLRIAGDATFGRQENVKAGRPARIGNCD